MGGPGAAGPQGPTARRADPKGVEGAASGKGGAPSSVLVHLEVPANLPSRLPCLPPSKKPAHPAPRPLQARSVRPGTGHLNPGRHGAALGAPLPRVPPATPPPRHRRQVQLPGKRSNLSAPRKGRAYWGEKVGNEKAAAAGLVT